MKASVIVLSWNGKPYLEDCLTAVLTQSYPDFEALLVDNASTDGSADFVAERFPRARIIRNSQNLGFAAGMNVGLKAAAGEILVLLNQDTVVRENWLTALVEAMAADREVGVAGCKILESDGKTIQHAGATLEYLSISHHYGYGELDQGQYDTLRAVDFVTGAAMGIKRVVVEKIGYLDEDFFPGYFEDVEFCLRAREAGYKVIYVPQAVLIHFQSSSIGQDSYAQNRYYHTNRFLFLLKNYTLDQLAIDLSSAERERLKITLPLNEIRALGRVYLENLLSLPRASRGEEDIQQVSEAIQTCRAELGRQRKIEPSDELLTERMTSDVEGFEKVEEARSKHSVVEHSLTSNRRWIGPLITFLREKFINVSGVRSYLGRQVEFNGAMIRFGDHLNLRLAYFSHLFNLLADWVTAWGTELEVWVRDGYTERTIIAGNVASLGQQLAELESRVDERLKAIDERLERIERALEKIED